MGAQEFLRLDPESDAHSEDSSGVELDLHAESAMDEFCSPGSSGIESGSEGEQKGQGSCYTVKTKRIVFTYLLPQIIDVLLNRSRPFFIQ